jgi:hypothetical protein
MDKKLNRSNTPARRYPALYERIIPIAIGLIVVILLVLLVITFGVALGVWANPA